MTQPTTKVAPQPAGPALQTSSSDLSFVALSPERRAWQRFRQHRLAMIGLTVLLLLIFMAVAAPLISPHDPYSLNARAIKAPPSFTHILGTDTAGRDGWARLVYASRVSLSVGVVSVSIYLVIATVLGSLAGFYGGRVDDVIMRLTDIVLCFPELIIIITVVSVLGASIYNVMLVIGLLGWPGLARLVRAQMLSLREQQFVEAARCLGIPTRRIIFRHVLPNVVPYILVAATFGVAGAILTEAGLSFLGLGVQPPTPSWGNMLSGAQNLTILERYIWIWLPPGLMIGISVLAINFIGDGLRDALDPRMIVR
ncbi:MAG: ABC transporter permease [Caldilineaceae bacterium]|nr:ABC transporter permease [Caldilineaceae bacterium]